METIQGLKTIEMPIKQFFLQYPITSYNYVVVDNKVELKTAFSRCSLGEKYNDDDVITIQQPNAEQALFILKQKDNFNICKYLGIKINGADVSIDDIKKSYTLKELEEFNSVMVFFVKEDIIVT